VAKAERLPLDEELLRALREMPDRTLGELADACGVPRSTFGRPLTGRLRDPLHRLLDDGVVEEHDGRYRLAGGG